MISRLAFDIALNLATVGMLIEAYLRPPRGFGRG
jgi:hypothetical protein